MQSSYSGVPGQLGPSPPQFTLRIVYIDYYMRKPVQGLHHCYSELQGCAVNVVPVIRIFGSTPSGQKACLHLHKVGAEKDS